MEKSDCLYKSYINILKEELVPAMGCTEPICLAYAAAKAHEILGTLPKKVDVKASGNIIKNVKSVIVPNTKGMKGLKASLAAFRNQKIGFVFQFHHLLPEFTAIENICIPAYINGMTKKEASAKAERLLDYLNLLERKNHKPSELSGGEQQRVAVARALINDPAVVLADEPSGNLDSKSAQELHQLFFNLRDEMGQTFVIVTHNTALASMSDRTIAIKDGKI